MGKQRTAFVCNNCGNESARWLGKCPSCGQWDTYKEIKLGITDNSLSAHGLRSIKAIAKPLHEIEDSKETRIDMCDEEFNRVLGGGLVSGSLVLLGGEPGIGKSTLTLQTLLHLNRKVLYVSGEESARQIKMRAERIMPGTNADTPLILCETRLEEILEVVNDIQPEILVIDSIQTMTTEGSDSTAGSLSQVRECATRLLSYAKGQGVAVILIGHITKEGTLAGPKVLEHIVDAVLQFEGDQQHLYRVLRGIKNRFGSTSELGIYEMRGNGLRQVTNPSELLLGQHNYDLSGTAIASAIEGVRPLLIETQALVSTAAYGTPQRTATGFDTRRLNMLLAVLEKRVGFKLMQKDVFLNIAGGLRITDPAIDLSVLAAVLSSNVDMPVPSGICMVGEVGLTGEIRPVARIEQRIAEAEKLGFKEMIIPNHNLSSIDQNKFEIRLVPARRVEEALRHILG